MNEKNNVIAAGFRALSGWRMILILWVAATLCALPLVAPLDGGLHAAFGKTLAGKAVLHNTAPDAGLYWIDYFKQETPWKAVSGGVFVAVTLTLLFQIFLAGGLVETVGREQSPFAAKFFGGCGRHFWHNLKCFVIFVIIAGIVEGIWLGVLGAIGKALFKNAAPHTLPHVIYHWLVLLVGLLFFALLSMAYDVARALRRFEATRGSWRAWGAGLKTVFRHPGTAFGIFFFWLIVGGILQFLLSGLEWHASPSVALTVFLVLLIQQIGVAIRGAARVATWGSIVAFSAAQP